MDVSSSPPFSDQSSQQAAIVLEVVDTRQKTACCHAGLVRYTASMPFGMGFGELVLILVIVMVVFGATKLPQLGDGLGRAIKNFKRSVGSLNEIDVTPKTGTPIDGTSDAAKDAATKDASKKDSTK